MSTIKDFKELHVWQLGIRLVKDVYALTKNFPKEGLYGLTSQMRRAAVSLPSNIAEGFNRASAKEFKQFLRIALGSSAELETQIIVSVDLDFVQQNTVRDLLEKINHFSRMSSSLITKLK